jgi:hypothetical protein
MSATATTGGGCRANSGDRLVHGPDSLHGRSTTSVIEREQGSPSRSRARLLQEFSAEIAWPSARAYAPANVRAKADACGHMQGLLCAVECCPGRPTCCLMGVLANCRLLQSRNPCPSCLPEAIMVGSLDGNRGCLLRRTKRVRSATRCNDRVIKERGRARTAAVLRDAERSGPVATLLRPPGASRGCGCLPLPEPVGADGRSPRPPLVPVAGIATFVKLVEAVQLPLVCGRIPDRGGTRRARAPSWSDYLIEQPELWQAVFKLRSTYPQALTIPLRHEWANG